MGRDIKGVNKMKCVACDKEVKTLKELAEHILDNPKTHHKGMQNWATLRLKKDRVLQK